MQLFNMTHGQTNQSGHGGFPTSRWQVVRDQVPNLDVLGGETAIHGTGETGEEIYLTTEMLA